MLLGDSDALIVRSATKVTAEVIELAPTLKVVGRAGVGVDNVDVEAATRRGIVVANAPESNVVSAAEHTVGLLVALARNIPQAHAALRRVGGSARSRAVSSSPTRRSACSASAASAGRSRAGARTADEGARPTTRSSPKTGSASSASRPHRSTRCSQRADFLTLHLPLNAETRGAINAAEIAKMRDGVRIVNAARGDLIDEDALIARARVGQGRRRGARRLRRGAVLGAAAPGAERRPDAAPRGLDRGGAGPRGSDRRRAGRRGAAGRARDERRQHPDGRRRGSGGARAVHPARRQARAARDGARGRRRARGSLVEARAISPSYDTRLLTVAALNGAFEGRTRPAGQLRERAADRRRARRRGGRRQAPLVARLPEPRRGRRPTARRSRAPRSAARTASGSSRRSATSSRSSWRR